MPDLMSVGTDKGLAQSSKTRNWEEMGQANISCLAAGKMKYAWCVLRFGFLIIAS